MDNSLPILEQHLPGGIVVWPCPLCTYVGFERRFTKRHMGRAYCDATRSSMLLTEAGYVDVYYRSLAVYLRSLGAIVDTCRIPSAGAVSDSTRDGFWVPPEDFALMRLALHDGREWFRWGPKRNKIDRRVFERHWTPLHAGRSTAEVRARIAALYLADSDGTARQRDLGLLHALR